MTLEEHNQRLVEYIDDQANLHDSQQCQEDCFFCQAENVYYEVPMEVPFDNLLEAHKEHHKEMGYPFLGCEYCQQELWISQHNEVWRSYAND